MNLISVVDTLYLYSNIVVAESFYHNYVKNDKANFLGTSSGRTWYEIDGNRVGICDETQAKKMNTYPFLIQYSKENCHNHNFPSYCSSVSSNSFSIQRLDYAIIFQSDSFKIERHFISPFRSFNYICSSDSIETVYMGKRRSGKVVRLYNKTIELSVKNDYKQMDLLSKSFDSLDNLYVLEIELHRKHIMDKFGDVKLGSISNLISYSSSVLSSIVFFPNTEENMKHYKNRNYSKFVDTFVLDGLDCGYVTTEKEVRSKPSLSYLCKRVNKIITSYINEMNISESSDYLSLYDILFTSIAEHHNDNIDSFEFSLSDYESEKNSHLLELSAKIGDNAFLENESYLAFKREIK